MRLHLTSVHLPWFILAASLSQQSLGDLNGDVSWLITVCERLLEGGTAYVDVLETNPPAAWLIYMPAVWVGRVIGVAPEPVVAASIFALGLTVCHLCKRLAPLEGEERQLFVNAIAALIIFMPGFSFAEREHVAVMAALPVLCLWSLPADKKIALTLRVAAAMLASLTIIIKPHFALVIGLPLLWRAFRLRRWMQLFLLEPLLIATCVLAYVALVILHYPALFDVLPSLIETYVPIRAPLRDMLTSGWFLAHLALMALVLWRVTQAALPMLAWQLLWGSIGFQIAYLIQMKGWTNHGLPGVTLAAASGFMLALSPLMRFVRGDDSDVTRRIVLMGVMPVGLGLLLLFGATMQFSSFEPHVGLRQAIRAAHPSPKIVSLTGALDVGHPVTRAVGGRWVARPHSTWMAIYVRILLYKSAPDPALRQRLEAYMERDISIFAEDVLRAQPDLILVDDDGYTEELMLHPKVRAVMQPYEPVGYASGITIWGRSDVRG